MFRTSLAGLLSLALASAAFAQPTPDVRRACLADALRLCVTSLPVRAAAARCMAAHWNALSDACRTAINARIVAQKDHPDPDTPPDPRGR